MLNIKFVVDVSTHPKLSDATHILRVTDTQLIEQHDWLVQKAKMIDKQRKEIANNFWTTSVKILKAEGKLPKDFELGGDTMITFGDRNSCEIFLIDRPNFIVDESIPR